MESDDSPPYIPPINLTSMNAQKQTKRFIVFSGVGKRQATKNVAMDDTAFDTRHNCTFTIDDDVNRETVYDCSQQDIYDEVTESQMKKLTVTYTVVTAQIIAFWLAYFLSAAASPVTSGSKKKHALTRSSDALAGFGFVEGFEDDTTPAQKYKDFKVDSIAFNLGRRKNVGMTVTCYGHYQTEDVTEDFVLPACQNLPALKGRDCKILIDAVAQTPLLWTAGINLNNGLVTGDDVFPWDSVDIDELQRGEKPTYPLTAQVLGSKGDTLYTQAQTGLKKSVEFQFGADTDDRVNLVFPTTKLKLASTPTPFVGELNRSAIALDMNPHKDAALGTPVKADAYLAQTQPFLAT